MVDVRSRLIRSCAKVLAHEKLEQAVGEAVMGHAWSRIVHGGLYGRVGSGCGLRAGGELPPRCSGVELGTIARDVVHAGIF